MEVVVLVMGVLSRIAECDSRVELQATLLSALLERLAAALTEGLLDEARQLVVA